MNQLERDYLLAQSVIKSLEQENARLLFFNRELVEENRQLKELNREMYILIRFIEMDIDDIIKRNVEIDWNSRKIRIAEILAKAGEQ